MDILDLNFAITLILITLAVVLISRVFTFKSKGWQKIRWMLSALITGAVGALRLTINPNWIAVHPALLTPLMLFVGCLIAFLITRAANPSMNLFFRMLLGIFVALALSLYIFQAFGLIPSGVIQILQTPLQLAIWLQALIWLTTTFLFAGAFNPKMSISQRVLLGIICGLALTAFLRDALISLGNG